jgi:hypothetical protein
MAFNSRDRIVTDGLVFYIDALNTKSYIGSGTVVNDLTTNNNNGSLVNGVGFDGETFIFDGINDHINIDSLISLIGNDTQGTIESWVNINNSTPIDLSAIFTVGDANVDSNFNVRCQPTGQVVSAFRQNGVTQWAVVTDNKEFEDNKWALITITQDSILPKLFFNGEMVQQTLTTNVNTTRWLSFNTLFDTVRIGNISSNNSPSVWLWNGSISLVKYYNRSLSSDEVLQNYNATKHRFI